MKQVLHNPFRILGLPVSATDRQIAKRVMEAETYLEMGKPLKVEGDFPWLPPVTRTPDAIKEAQGRLHRLEDRCYHAMFWFHAHDSVDQLALEVLQDGNVEKAVALWTKQPTVSHLINLYVLHFALSSEEGRGSEDPFLKALSYAGQAFNTDGIEAFHRKINGERSDRTRILQDMAQETLQRIAGSNKLIEVANKDIRQVFSVLIHFPPEGRNWLEDRFIAEYRECLDEAVQKSKDARGLFPEDAVDNALDLLDVSRPIIEKLKFVLSPSDPRFVLLSDQIGNELLQCAIDYHNFVMDQEEEEELELQPAADLAEIANEFACGPVLKGRIRENLPLLADHVVNQEERKAVGRPTKEVFRLLETLPKLDSKELLAPINMFIALKPFLNNVKAPLLQLRDAAGRTDNRYIELSSLVVQVSLSILIKYGNHSFTATLPTTMTEILPFLDILSNFDMDPETRERLISNRRTVQGNIGARGTYRPPPTQANNRSSCYIATCVYGDPMAAQVVALRRFRDDRLQNSVFGRGFIAIYYAISPYLAKHLARFPRLHAPIRRRLDGLIRRWCDTSEPSRRNPAC